MNEEVFEGVSRRIHQQLKERFFYRDVLLDYAGLDGGVQLPTAEDMAAGRPNLLGWWTPMENGAFFNGIYLGAVCDGFKIWGEEGYRAQAGALAKALLELAEVSKTPGFIARGALPDGSHYAAGSDDQTGPWFYGLWKYLDSGIPTAAQRAGIQRKMEQVACALLEREWKLPCSGRKEHNGDFLQWGFRSCVRILWLTKLMHRLSGETKWKAEHEKRREEALEGKRRLDICRAGMEYSFFRNWEMAYQLWIFLDAIDELEMLERWEEEEDIQKAYRQGRERSARAVCGLISRFGEYGGAQPLAFTPVWQEGQFWRPGMNLKESKGAALAQMEAWEERYLPQRKREIRFMREPLCACLIASRSPDEAFLRELEPLAAQCVSSYDVSKLYTSLFFVGECVCNLWLTRKKEQKEKEI